MTLPDLLFPPPGELEVYVITWRTVTQAAQFVDVRRELEQAQRRAVFDAGRPLAFEAQPGGAWEAVSAYRRVYRIERRLI